MSHKEGHFSQQCINIYLVFMFLRSVCILGIYLYLHICKYKYIYIYRYVYLDIKPNHQYQVFLSEDTAGAVQDP